MRSSRPTRTPGTLYYVRQTWPALSWQVVPISEGQGEFMRERGERIYDTSAQAYAVAKRLNDKRKVVP